MYEFIYNSITTGIYWFKTLFGNQTEYNGVNKSEATDIQSATPSPLSKATDIQSATESHLSEATDIQSATSSHLSKATDIQLATPSPLSEATDKSEATDIQLATSSPLSEATDKSKATDIQSATPSPLSEATDKSEVESLVKPLEPDEITVDLYSLTPKNKSPRLSIQIPEPKKYMFLDTETTGIPQQKSYNKYYEPHYISFYEDARMIELGYVISDDAGNIMKEQSFLIKPDGFVIKNTKIHGITTEKATSEGIPIRDALEQLHADLQTVDKLICHNTEFDVHILLSECYREYRTESELIQKIKSIPKQCTMEMGKRIFKLKKYPRLVELYTNLFENEPVQEHRALSDVYLCYDCYFLIHKS
jgi:DNA polymerase-3 subunit epsilon